MGGRRTPCPHTSSRRFAISWPGLVAGYGLRRGAGGRRKKIAARFRSASRRGNDLMPGAPHEGDAAAGPGEVFGGQEKIFPGLWMFGSRCRVRKKTPDSGGRAD